MMIVGSSVGSACWTLRECGCSTSGDGATSSGEATAAIRSTGVVSLARRKSRLEEGVEPCKLK